MLVIFGVPSSRAEKIGPDRSLCSGAINLQRIAEKSAREQHVVSMKNSQRLSAHLSNAAWRDTMDWPMENAVIAPNARGQNSITLRLSRAWENARRCSYDRPSAKGHACVRGYLSSFQTWRKT